MAALLPWLLASAVLFLALQLAIALSNRSGLRRLEGFASPGPWPSVTVLVPARDEETHIEACLRSLLAQDYPLFEVLALDDGSQDRTGEILAQLAAEDGRLSLVQSEPPPPGWLGKNWACHQLASRASGELLLFTDADTRHQPGALRAVVAASQDLGSDLLTGIPWLRAVSWGERLILPLIPWSIFTLLPINLAHQLQHPALSATIGQFCLFRRSAYSALGGHQAVRDHAAEDLALGRLTKRRGYRWRLVDAQSLVSSRMYSDRGSAWRGLSKNLYPAFGYRLPALVWGWGWLAFVAWIPWIALLAPPAAGSSATLTLSLAAAALILNLALWGMTLRRFRYPLILMPLYPILLLSGCGLALSSVWLTVTGRATWKGRRLGQKAEAASWATTKTAR